MLFCVYMCMGLHATEYTRKSGQHVEVSFLLLPCGSQDQTQVVSLKLLFTC